MTMSMRTARRRQLACAVGVLGLLVWVGLATPVFFGQLLVVCPESLCTRFERPTPETLSVLGAAGVSVRAYATIVTALAWLEFLLLAGVAALLVLSHRIRGPLVVVTAVLCAGTGLAPFTEALGGSGGPAAVLDLARAVAVSACIPVFVALFPDGRWSPRWLRRWWPVLTAAEVALIIGPVMFGPSFDDATLQPLPGLLLVVFYLGVQVRRFRRVSDWAARQQAKWVLAAFVLMVANALFAALAIAAGVIAAYQLVAVASTYLAFAALGAGLALGLLRYRLYDADVVLRRTVLYAGAIIVLAAAYVGLVAAASALVTGTAASVAGAVGVAVLALGGGLLAYLLRDRLRRRLFGGDGLTTAIAALARGDVRTAAGSDLAETIAAGLGVPYTAVLDPDGATLWAYGRPGGHEQRESVVDDSGIELGALVLAPPRGSTRLDRHHRRLLGEVLPFVVLVLRARAEADELRAARTAAASAREDERRRLRRDLHDGVGPLLASQLLMLDTIRVAGDRPELLAHLEAQARSAIGEVRRVAHDLRPPELDAGGLPAALTQDVERLGAAGLPVRLEIDLGGAALPAAVEVAVLRIVREALANVMRHAAASRVEVRLTADEGGIELGVIDDGRGRGGAPDGMGSASMHDRAQELGGTFSSSPGPGGTGTEIRARIPL